MHKNCTSILFQIIIKRINNKNCVIDMRITNAIYIIIAIIYFSTLPLINIYEKAYFAIDSHFGLCSKYLIAKESSIDPRRPVFPRGGRSDRVLSSIFTSCRFVTSHRARRVAPFAVLSE